MSASDESLIEDLQAELESCKRTCAARDQRIEALEKEVAQDARAIRVLDERNAEHLRNYTNQLLLKDMANGRAAKHDQRAIDLQARLESSRALVERLNNDVIARDEALEATRTELLKQIDMWKEDSAAWRKAWRVVGKIRDQRTAERDMWKEEALRAGRQVVEGNKLREHQAQEHFEGSQVAFGKFSDEILRLEGENRRLRAEHAALLAESTEIARLKLKMSDLRKELEEQQSRATLWWYANIKLEVEIDHLEAQRAAWFSELSRLERVEEESWELRITVEEGQDIIGELAGALAHLLDEPLTPCKAVSCAGHNGPKAHKVIKEARTWAAEKVAYMEELETARKRQTARLISANEKIKRLEKESDRRAAVRVRRMRLIAALRDRIEELEETLKPSLPSIEFGWNAHVEACWALRVPLRKHLEVHPSWHSPQPFWSEKLRTRGFDGEPWRVWTVGWLRAPTGEWSRQFHRLAPEPA